MFEWLGKLAKIVVTGPHRSGTRICAQMIADDTGHEYVDEYDIDFDSLHCLYSLLHNKRHFVVQCPALCRYAHLLSADDTAIVFMRRHISDIVASQQRIGWNGERVELTRYGRTEGVAAEVKYRFWEENQRKKIKHAFEIDYESLDEHPLWVPRNLRQDFGPTRTTYRIKNLAIRSDIYPRSLSSVLRWGEADHNKEFLCRKGPIKSLNATGQMVWELCDGTRTCQDILQELKAHFDDVDETILTRDLDKFISSLVNQGFLWLSSKANGKPSGSPISDV